MINIYRHWDRHRDFFKKRARVPWSEAFEPNEANSQSVRFTKLRPWLEYLDSNYGMVAATATDAITKMVAIAQALKKREHVFVKDVFYIFATKPEKMPDDARVLFQRLMAEAGLAAI